MKNKRGQGISVGAVVTIILILTTLISSFVLIRIIFYESNIIITQQGMEVNNLVACCFTTDNTDQFEHITVAPIVGWTTTRVPLPNNKTFCVPEENLKYSVFLCSLLTKNDISLEWLELNSEGCMANQDGECLYYKFGSYEIEPIK